MCLFADMISSLMGWMIWTTMNFGFAGATCAIACFIVYKYISSSEEIQKENLARLRAYYDSQSETYNNSLNSLKVQYSTDLAYRDQDHENSITLIRADYEEKLYEMYGERDALQTMLTEERVNRDEILKSDHEHHTTLLRAKEAWFQEVVEKMKISEQEVLQGKNNLISKYEKQLEQLRVELHSVTTEVETIQTKEGEKSQSIIQTLEEKLKAEIETANSFRSEYTRICSQDILNKEEIQRLNNIILAKNASLSQLQQENAEALKVEIETAKFFRQKADSESEVRKQSIKEIKQMLGDTVIAELDALKSRLLYSILESNNDAN